MLKVQGLNKDYDEVKILENINFEIESSEIVCLLGSSGSGKTTLLKILSGLLSYEKGIIKYRAFDLDSVSKNTSIAFQDIKLFPNLNGKKNCLIGLEKNRSSNNKLKKVVEELNVVHCLTKKPHQMSQGERHRIGLARSLVRDVKLFFLDEPTASLDPENRNILANLISRFKTQLGVSFIIATHDFEFANVLGERFFTIKNGRLEISMSLNEATSKLSGKFVD